jgi:LDH2 family malate/lactate/ureidoglycolate dehydrogenase
MISDKHGIISIAEARRFMVDCFLKSNSSLENSQAMADLLAEADYRGHFSKF